MTIRSLKAALAVAFVAAFMACGGGDEPAPVMNVDGDGASSIDVKALSVQLAAYPMDTLSPEEKSGLLFMREEEQLAHDVYAVSAVVWASPIFDNITSSEATHAAAMQTLLDRYGLADPLAGLPNGTFATPAFQALYDSLVATSRLSLIDALKVGVEIEELDLRDITALKASVNNADILMVYENLLRGSRNHLRAFMKLLTLRGGTYVPKYISQAEFDAIVNSPIETGR